MTFKGISLKVAKWKIFSSLWRKESIRRDIDTEISAHISKLFLTE